VWFENRSDIPYMVTASAASSDEAGRPSGRAADVIVSPPAKLVGAHEKAAFKTVFVGDAKQVDAGTERLRYLRLHAVPGEKAAGQKDEGVKVSVSTTSWLKVFVRPVRLRVRNAAKAAELDARCRGGKALLHNASPYWLTVRSVLAGKKESIPQNEPSPMLAPGAELPLDGIACGRPLRVKLVDDYGMLVSAAVRNGEGG
jgi:P pilus assembly chaperone PapD